jgi:hypothetical protein
MYVTSWGQIKNNNVINVTFGKTKIVNNQSIIFCNGGGLFSNQKKKKTFIGTNNISTENQSQKCCFDLIPSLDSS